MIVYAMLMICGVIMEDKSVQINGEIPAVYTSLAPCKRNAELLKTNYAGSCTKIEVVCKEREVLK
jgi:hypothetical protein